MASEAYLPGNILSMAGAVADRLMAAGSGDAALLYLYLLKNGGRFDPSGAAKALKWEPKRCRDALSLLVRLELADGAEAPPPPASAEPPEYTSADISQELEDAASPFPALVSEVQQIGRAHV